jgi:hypothetical protein
MPILNYQADKAREQAKRAKKFRRLFRKSDFRFDAANRSTKNNRFAAKIPTFHRAWK